MGTPENVHWLDQLTVFSQTVNLLKIRQFVSEAIERSPMPASEKNKVIIAIDEAVANVINHGYENQDNGVIDIILKVIENRFIVHIRDTGRIYNPQSHDEVNLDEHVKAGKKRGLGIMIIKKIMDEIKYDRNDIIQNELTMVKYFKSEAS